MVWWKVWSYDCLGWQLRSTFFIFVREDTLFNSIFRTASVTIGTHSQIILPCVLTIWHVHIECLDLVYSDCTTTIAIYSCLLVFSWCYSWLHCWDLHSLFLSENRIEHSPCLNHRFESITIEDTGTTSTYSWGGFVVNWQDVIYSFTRWCQSDSDL